MSQRSRKAEKRAVVIGLDMYLSFRKSVSGYNFAGSDKTVYDALLSAAGLTDLETEARPHASIEVTVMYWRKANAIHGWFVDELAGGKDECQEIGVTRENLIALRGLCEEVALQPSVAGEVLPPTKGFFFGSDEVDEYYLEYMKDTAREISDLLDKLPEEGEGWDWSLVYQASW